MDELKKEVKSPENDSAAEKDAAAEPEEKKTDAADGDNSDGGALKQALKDGGLGLSDDDDFDALARAFVSKSRVKRSFERGDSKHLFRFTLLNGIVYTAWFFIYVYGTVLRYSAFIFTPELLAASSLPSFTIEVRGPLFGVLKAFAGLLPVVVMLWAVLISANARKGKKLVDKRLVTAVMAVDIIVLCTVAADIISLHMVFA